MNAVSSHGKSGEPSMSKILSQYGQDLRDVRCYGCGKYVGKEPACGSLFRLSRKRMWPWSGRKQVLVCASCVLRFLEKKWKTMPRPPDWFFKYCDACEGYANQAHVIFHEELRWKLYSLRLCNTCYEVFRREQDLGFAAKGGWKDEVNEFHPTSHPF